MRLLVHIGIYKTASSYLQYVCANKKGELTKQGIFFPPSRFDKTMLEGGVSPGNGNSLSAFMRKKDRDGINNQIATWIDQAKSQRCNNILISSELLVHDFANQDSFKLLEEVIEDSAIHEVSIIAFIRDFVDHALSTYKHRAKSGQFTDFRTWVAKQYETPQVLSNLLERIYDSEWDWNLYKFEKNTKSLYNIFFKEWLEIDLQKDLPEPTVNESISLSEVILMTSIRRHYSHVYDRFIEVLKSIPKNKKGNDSELEVAYKIMAQRELVKKKPLIKKINSILKGSNLISIPGDVNTDQPINNVDNLVFSLEQLEAIITTIETFRSWKGKGMLLRRKIKAILPKSVINRA